LCPLLAEQPLHRLHRLIKQLCVVQPVGIGMRHIHHFIIVCNRPLGIRRLIGVQPAPLRPDFAHKNALIPAKLPCQLLGEMPSVAGFLPNAAAAQLKQGLLGLLEVNDNTQFP